MTAEEYWNLVRRDILRVARERFNPTEEKLRRLEELLDGYNGEEEHKVLRVLELLEEE